MELYNKIIFKNKIKLKHMIPHFETSKMIEPVIQNLWTLSFPNDYNIPEYCVSKVSSLKYSSINGWRKITITMLDLMGISITKTLIENLVRVPLKITLKKLDLTGACVETINIQAKEFEVNYGKFDYSSEKLNKIKVTLKPTNVIVL